MNIEPQSGLYYLERRASENSAVKPILILLHGYGSHEGDLFSFASELPAQFHILSIRAPYSLPWGGYCWYNLEFDATGTVRKGNMSEAFKSIEQLHTFIQEKSAGQKVYLMGFSQGAILSYALAFNHSEKVGGIAALSGYLQKELLPEKKNLQELAHLKIYMTHGTEDAVIPVQMAQQSSQFLANQNITHIYREYPVGHGIDAPMFYELRKWLEKNFN